MNRYIPWIRARSTVLALSFAGAAHAAPVSGWAVSQNSTSTPAGPLTGASTASPVMGDGTTTNSANAMGIYASFAALTLANVGDKLTLSGSATFVGITATNNQFRFGLYDVNGSATTSGWLGYFASHGNTTTGASLWERAAGNNTIFQSTATGPPASIVSASTQTAAAPGTYSFSSGTYHFLLSFERIATGLQVNSSVIRSSDSQQFGLNSFVDTSVSTYNFNRVGLTSGNGQNAEQVQFSNIDVAFSNVTDPGGLQPLPPGTVRLLGIDFNRDDALGSPSQSRFRVISGSATGAGNTASYQKTIGGRAVTVSQPDGIPFEFRGANTDGTRAIPGGDVSRSFLVSDFIATRNGRIQIRIGSLPAGNYRFRSYHLDPFTGSTFSFAQGSTTTTRNTIEARIGGILMDSVQPTCLGAPGLNTTFINDNQIPALDFTISHDGSPTLTIELEATQANGADRYLLLNGFELFALPTP